MTPDFRHKICELNHGKYFFNVIGKQGGNYSQKKTFSIDNVIIDIDYRTVRKFQMSS